MKRNYESSKHFLKKDWKYVCEFTTIADIVEYLKTDEKTLPYLQKLSEHKNLFRYSDVCIVVDGHFLLYAKAKENKYKNLVDVIRLTTDEIKKVANENEKNQKEVNEVNQKEVNDKTETEVNETNQKEVNDEIETNNNNESDESDDDNFEIDIDCVIV